MSGATTTPGIAEQATKSLKARVLVALAVALAAGLLSMVKSPGWRQGDGLSDFDQVWAAARMLANRQDPYANIGPGLPFDWRWPLYYPLTTIIGSAPLALLPLATSRLVFLGLSAGLLAFAVSRRDWDRLAILASGPAISGILAGQWAPLLTAGFLLNAGWLLAFKPTVGLALALATFSRRTLAGFTIALGLLASLAFAWQPAWFGSWRAAIETAGHFRLLLLRPLGPLLLLAIPRWRCPEARILLALACVPQTPVIYEALPLLLVPRSRWSMLGLLALSIVEPAAQVYAIRGLATVEAANLSADYLLLFLYLPALAIILIERPGEQSGRGRSSRGPFGKRPQWWYRAKL